MICLKVKQNIECRLITRSTYMNWCCVDFAFYSEQFLCKKHSYRGLLRHFIICFCKNTHNYFSAWANGICLKQTVWHPFDFFLCLCVCFSLLHHWLGTTKYFRTNRTRNSSWGDQGVYMKSLSFLGMELYWMVKKRSSVK